MKIWTTVIREGVFKRLRERESGTVKVLSSLHSQYASLILQNSFHDLLPFDLTYTKNMNITYITAFFIFPSLELSPIAESVNLNKLGKEQ